MGEREGPQSGPPRGRGRYAEDGRWWWDEGRGRWFRTSEQRDTLEVELEDVGGRSWWQRLLTVLGGQYGTFTYRFVGRARSADDRWPVYEVASGTFPVQPLQLPLDDLDDRAAWTPEVEGSLRALRERLEAEGWQPTGRGAHWWSLRYERPVLDLDTPQGAFAASHRGDGA